LPTAETDPIGRARAFTRTRIDRVREALSGLPLPPDAVVAVCGSYGRAEASEPSDFDYFILTEHSEPRTIDLGAIEQAIASVVPKPPARGGAFGAARSFPEMLDAIGGDEDSNGSITRRTLFLLESRIVTNEAVGLDYRRKLVDRYIDDSISDRQVAMLFLNDVIRYYRTICVDFEYKTGQQGKSWGIRNIKLVFSRKLLYFSGVLAAAEVAQMTPARKRERLADILALSPLARVEAICGSAAGPVLDLYSEFLDSLGDGDTRAVLEAVGPADRRTSPVFRELKDRGHRFSWALLRALEATYHASHPIHRALVM